MHAEYLALNRMDIACMVFDTATFGRSVAHPSKRSYITDFRQLSDDVHTFCEVSILAACVVLGCWRCAQVSRETNKCVPASGRSLIAYPPLSDLPAVWEHGCLAVRPCKSVSHNAVGLCSSNS